LLRCTDDRMQRRAGIPEQMQQRFRPPMRKLTFRQKVPQRELTYAAIKIQAAVRKRIRGNLYRAIDQGSAKVYVQKHAAAAITGAAILVQSAYRRYEAARKRQDLVEERNVDEYNRQRPQKQFAFKPRYPPSYYRASATLIQTRVRAKRAASVEPADQAIRRWEKLRRYYKAGGVRSVAAAFEKSAIVFKPRLSQSDAQRVRAIRRGYSSGSANNAYGEGQKAHRPPAAPAVSVASRTSPASLMAAEARAPAASPPALAMPTASVLAVPEWLDEATERQQQAESAFFQADTSGDGLVDEGELVVLIMRMLTLGESERPKVEAFVATFRPEDGSALELDFDDFVDVYNRVCEARSCGDIG